MRTNKVLLFIYCLYIMHGISHAGQQKKIFPLTDSPLKLSGYTHIGYSYLDKGINGFRIRRARMKLNGEVLRNVIYKIQVDTTKTSILLDATIELASFQYARLTFGQFKIPFSLENLTSSSALDTINRSQTVEKLCPGRDIRANGRDIGVAITGEFSKVGYTLGVFNGSGINKSDYNKQKDIVGRLVFSPYNFLALGIAHYKGRYSSSPESAPINKLRNCIEMSLVHHPFSIKSEFIFGKDDKTDKYGWYVQGEYFLVPKKIQAIIKYDSFDKDKDMKGEKIDVITLGLNLVFSKKNKLQINYEFHREEKREISNDQILAQFQVGF